MVAAGDGSACLDLFSVVVISDKSESKVGANVETKRQQKGSDRVNVPRAKTTTTNGLCLAGLDGTS